MTSSYLPAIACLETGDSLATDIETVLDTRIDRVKGQILTATYKQMIKDF